MSKQDRIGRAAYILYKGGVKDEEPLDDHSSGEPLRVILGENAVPKGIEAALFEMEIGERRELEIAPDLGYGHPRPEGIQWYPKMMIERGDELKIGDTISCTNKEDRSTLPGRIVAETQDLLQVDVNHPFAGKTLSYWVELVDLK